MLANPAFTPAPVSVLFSEPKIPQLRLHRRRHLVTQPWFQYSSASRKFLNRIVPRNADQNRQVSVLFSEPKIPQSRWVRNWSGASTVSVLFSEPKIPQSAVRAEPARRFWVSVLFSEPKIPQCSRFEQWLRQLVRFQYSSASRKFLNPDPRTCVHPYSRLRRSRFVVPEPSWCVAMTPVY